MACQKTKKIYRFPTMAWQLNIYVYIYTHIHICMYICITYSNHGAVVFLGEWVGCDIAPEPGSDPEPGCHSDGVPPWLPCDRVNATCYGQCLAEFPWCGRE